VTLGLFIKMLTFDMFLIFEMKNFYLLLYFFIGLWSFNSLAQTPRDIEKIVNASNLEELRKIEEEEEIRFQKNKAEAYRVAQLRGIDTIVELPNGGIRELIGIDGEQLLFFETDNIDGAASTRANQLHFNTSLGLNLEGENLIVHVWDSGIANINHIEYGDENHFSRYIQGNPNSSSSPHSAHVTGSIMARGLTPEAIGTAPKSAVKGFNWNFDINEGAAEVANGMLISNHSYGFDISSIPTWYFGSYIARSRAWDNIQYNAPYFLMVNSAGNDGTSTENDSPLNPNFPQYDKLSGRKTGKNGIVVANAAEVYTTSNGDFISATINNSSSQGPTNDYRIKPDITALGTDIFSTRHLISNYYTASGTSMASPMVAGSFLLLQELAKEETGFFIKASTLKGLALHTADQVEVPGPNAIYGWGIMNAKRAAETLINNGTNSIVEELTLNEGESYSFEVVSNGLEKLQVSISWTDPAGEVNSNIINDTPYRS